MSPAGLLGGKMTIITTSPSLSSTFSRAEGADNDYKGDNQEACNRGAQVVRGGAIGQGGGEGRQRGERGAGQGSGQRHYQCPTKVNINVS